jgi:signal transduction histidine kinase/ligand-binding sensor domain-containing protein
MRKRMLNLLLTGLALLPLRSLAVAPYEPARAEPVLEPWRWHEMTALSGRGVLCVDEAQDGALWFGGVGGLLRYDGMQVEWMPFDERLKAAIGMERNRRPWCRSVLCMRDGSLLAVLETTLLEWRDGVWRILQGGLGSVEYNTHLVHGDGGVVWLLESQGLWRFGADLRRPAAVIRAKPEERAVAFCPDGKGGAWVVMERPQAATELIHIPFQEGHPLAPEAWNRYPIDGSGYSREASICAGPEGRLWFVDSKGDGKVRAFDPGCGTWEAVDNPTAQTGFFSLFKDRYGTLWAGGSGALLAIRNGACDFFSSVALGLPSVPVSVFEAENGWWWVILRGGYVYRLDPGQDQWRTYHNLHFECESAEGAQWFMRQDRHVVSYEPDKGRWLEYTTQDGLIDFVLSLHASRHGLIWAVGSHQGRAAFSVFDGKQWRIFRHPEFALLIGKGAVYEASDGSMWFGAAGDKLRASSEGGGALQYEVRSGQPHVLKQHRRPALPYAISRFAQTPDGALWLGAPQLFRYRPDTEEPVTFIPELPSVYTYDMATDAKGGLWVAKGLFGIFHKTGDGWQQYSEGAGLCGKLFVSLLLLQDRTLLAASERGVSRFDGEGWTGAVFSEDFGLSSRGGSMRQSRDGALWFNFSDKDARSSRTAMNLASEGRFCTVRYRADTRPPETAIDEHVGRVDSEGNIYVSWSGVDPWANTRADNLQFSWRLSGGAWSPFSRQTGRTFLGLRSGDYLLEVRARDHDFNTDPTPARSRFTVALPVWRRPWFVALMLLLIGGTVAFIWTLFYYRDRRFKDRTKQLEEIDQMKTGFFTNISHELNTPLHVVKGALQRLASPEGKEEGDFLLTMALRNVDRMTLLTSQLLDFGKLEQGRMRIEPVNGDYSKLLYECLESIQPLAAAHHVTLSWEGGKPCQGWFDPEKLKMIVSNLVGNAIKYTPAQGAVRVVLETDEQRPGGRALSLTVEDTGRGIAPEHLPHVFERFYRSPEKRIIDGSGIGLNLVKELVDLWGGELRAESPICPDLERPGTRFTVWLPIELEQIRNRGQANEDDKRQ